MTGHRFGGESAQILWRTLRWTSFFVGALALAIGAGLIVLLRQLPHGSEIAPPLLACLAFIVVARVALDAVHSGELGSLWRGTGAGPSALSRALGRVVLANLGWLIPFAIVLHGRSQLAYQSEQQFASLAIAALLALLLPPVLLVVALGAESWPRLFSTAHWQGLFGGRGADLLQLYSTYLGSLLGLGLVLWGTVIGLGDGNMRFTLFLALVAGSYQAGLALLLLGRLIGAFLSSNSEDDAGLAAAPRGMAPNAGQPDASDEGVDAPLTMPASRSASAAPASRAEKAPTEVAPTLPRVEGSADSLLLRLRQIERTAAADPGAALSELIQLRQERGAHALILTRTAVLEQLLGLHSAETVGKEAVQTARQSGNVGALAELELGFGESAERIGIDANDWLRIAAVHQTLGREDEAVRLYVRLLESGAPSAPALKALLKIAQGREKQDRDLEGALSVYALILRLAPGHEFAEFAERGRAVIERRMLRAI